MPWAFSSILLFWNFFFLCVSVSTQLSLGQAVVWKGPQVGQLGKFLVWRHLCTISPLCDPLNSPVNHSLWRNILGMSAIFEMAHWAFYTKMRTLFWGEPLLGICSWISYSSEVLFFFPPLSCMQSLIPRGPDGRSKSGSCRDALSSTFAVGVGHKILFCYSSFSVVIRGLERLKTRPRLPILSF